MTLFDIGWAGDMGFGLDTVYHRDFWAVSLCLACFLCFSFSVFGISTLGKGHDEL